MAAVWLAFLSGIPALIYQVVWTRQVGLLAGGQVGAISVVLVAFFGGLAIGNWFLGPRSDRTTSALRLYGMFEIGAGLTAAFSTSAFRWLAQFGALGDFELLAASALILLPSTILLGGTLPALLRLVSAQSESAPRQAGRLIGFNTAGSIVGVGLAILSIPTLGLRTSMIGAAAGSVAIGGIALLCSGAVESPAKPKQQPARPPVLVLAAAFLLGVGTLGFEVLATRLASLRLGSTLYAWGFVLALFLIGLALGNFALARRARATSSPERDLGAIEVAAACSVVLGLALLRPNLASPATTLDAANLGLVALGILPGATCMGGAFPLLVRLASRDERIATAFGRVSAINTLGGVIGALLAPFVLLPSLGLIASGTAFAATNALVGLAFLPSGRTIKSSRPIALGIACLLIATLPILRPPAPANDPWVLFVAEGRQSTAVVTSSWGNRTLIVDGDPEAAVTGDARRTEELLAVLPLLLHPAPLGFLEIGLGSGITLGTATRFSLEQIDCVEIAESVIRAAPFFEPDNRGIAHQDSVTIIHEDARRLLAQRPETYDVISANTLHPWSIGATGLYSREYFSRMAGALRPGGIAVQWIPIQQIEGESVSLILRTFFDVFPEGGLWWGAGNIIAVGSLKPIPETSADRNDARMRQAELTWQNFGWESASDISSYRIGTADAVRAALGSGEFLVDDRPRLELHAARTPSTSRTADLFTILVTIAKESAGRGAMLFWLESLEMRAAGDESTANTLEGLAVDLGLDTARRARLSRLVAAAHLDHQAGHIDDAFDGFNAAILHDPIERYALFGRAGIAIQRGELDAAITDLELIVTHWPDDVRAWNELAGAFSASRDFANAQHALDRAMIADPYDIRALANAGLIALELRQPDLAVELLSRIRAVSPLGQSTQEIVLARAIERIENGGR